MVLVLKICVFEVENNFMDAEAIKPNEFIFTQNGTLTQTYYEQVKAACASCGIVYWRKVAGGLIPYDLRHTATTLIMHSGADFETVSSITGESRHTLWHYTREQRINRAPFPFWRISAQTFSMVSVWTKKKSANS